MNIKTDVFPARLAIAPTGSLPEGQPFTVLSPSFDGLRRLDRCRVVLIDNFILIAIDSPEGPKLVFKEEVASYSKEEKNHKVLTKENKTLVFTKDKNCSCGSRLRSWSPWKDYNN